MTPFTTPRRVPPIAAAVLLSLMLAGCATAPPPPSQADAAADPAAEAEAEKRPSPADPWERWNRKVYAFNDAIDVAVVKPVAIAYTNVVPQPIRTGVTNFYGNFADVWSAVNNVLQGKVLDGLQDVMRVSTNTLFGVAGLFDVASEFGLDSQREDFGQTLGRWGLGPGPYIVWPLLGPSTVRDSFALPLDRSASPSLLVSGTGEMLGVTVLGLLDQRASLLPTSRMLDDIALDKYSFVRDGYLQRRRSLVFDGDEPEPVEPAAGTPAAASAPASDGK